MPARRGPVINLIRRLFNNKSVSWMLLRIKYGRDISSSRSLRRFRMIVFISNIVIQMQYCCFLFKYQCLLHKIYGILCSMKLLLSKILCLFPDFNHCSNLANRRVAMSVRQKWSIKKHSGNETGVFLVSHRNKSAVQGRDYSSSSIFIVW